MSVATSSRSGATRLVGRVLAVVAGLAPLTWLGVLPASAEERVVAITAEGVRPQVLQVRAGDTVRFVNEDRTFAYRAQSTGGAWRFDSGPVRLLTSDFVVPTPLTRPGTYTYRVAQDALYRGSVVLAGAPAPSGSAPAGSWGSAPAATPGVQPQASVSPSPAAPGPSGPSSDRGLAVPTALATLLVAGAASSLLRLLLTETVLSDRPGTL